MFFCAASHSFGNVGRSAVGRCNRYRSACGAGDPSLGVKDVSDPADAVRDIVIWRLMCSAGPMRSPSRKESRVSAPIRIGEILIEQGVLSAQQVFEIVQAQKREGLPFGVLAERMCDVTMDAIEKAWVEQYHRFTGEIDLAQVQVDEQALRLINRRQAWQFEILPLRFEEGGELLMAASRKRLARAVAFAAARLEPVVYFRICESRQLRHFLQKHYPMPEVSQDLLDRARDLVA
jgi:hypothetical protein